MIAENTKEMLLLPHQFELITDTTTRILGLCSGYGGGKTHVAARKAIMLARLNSGCDGIVTEPTFPLLTQVMFPAIKEALEFFEIKYRFNKVESIFYCMIDGKETRIICGSMENYERLVGINAAWVICDEFDTSKPKTAYEAFIKLLGRLRAGTVRQMVIVSTPEGFKAMHRIFVKEKDDSKRLIKAKTTDNKYLPQDYIETLRAQYPEQLLNAYINGEFVNLTSGSVYDNYDRRLNNTTRVWDGEETIYIGMDFNVGNMSAIIHVKDKGEPRAVGEIIGAKDTPDIINVIKARYSTASTIRIYPDASGKSRKTVDASKSDISLLESAGFRVYANAANPAVKDRIIAMQVLFLNNEGKRRYLVNVDKCPTYAENLEQQVYGLDGAPDKKAGNDHTNDAGGYFIAYEYPIVRPVAKYAVRFAN